MGIIVADAEGRLRHWNAEATRLLGDDLAARSVTDWGAHCRVFLPDGQTPYPADQSPMARAMRGESVDDDEQVLRVSGEPEPRALRVSARPLEPGAAPAAAVGVFSDVTQQRTAERSLRAVLGQLRRQVADRSQEAELLRELGSRLERDALRARDEAAAADRRFAQAQRMEAIGQLASGLAHEFNNQLSAVIGFAELAARDLPAKHSVRDDLREVLAAGRRAAEVAGRLLSFSRQQGLDARVTDVSALVHSMRPLLRQVLGPGVTLTCTLAEPPLLAKLDGSQLEQALLNLTLNARHAMGEHGRFIVETTLAELDADYASTHPGVRPGEHVCVSVSDNGSGMDAETRARVFDPFFTTKGVGEGTGLGLAMVHGFVRQSAGHVWVYSEVGQGTTFRLYFPVARGPAASVAPAEPDPSPVAGTERVVVVDDEPSLRTLIERTLRAEGYSVTLCDGPDALAALGARSSKGPDLVISDWVMPDGGGARVAEIVSSAWPGTRLLFISGLAADAVLNLPAGEAEVRFLAKPITPQSLLQKVRAVLG